MCMQPFVKFLLCSFWYLQKFHLKRTELSSATRGWSRWRIVGGGRWRKVFISFRDTFVPWLSIKKRERRLKACTTSCALAMTTWTHINGRKNVQGCFLCKYLSFFAEGQAAQQTPNSINGSEIARRNPNWIFIDLLSAFLLSQCCLRRSAWPPDFRHRTQPFVCRQKASRFRQAWKSFTCHGDSCQLERAKGKSLSSRMFDFTNRVARTYLLLRLSSSGWKKGRRRWWWWKSFQILILFSSFAVRKRNKLRRCVWRILP